MIVKILFNDGQIATFHGILHWRYNPVRSILILQRFPGPDKLACPEVKKIPVDSILAMSATDSEKDY